MKSRYKITYETKQGKPKKSTSLVNINDRLIGTTKQLTPVTKLGDGTYGIVRLFSHDSKKRHIDIAVKQLQTEFTTNLTFAEMEEAKNEIEKEFAFAKRAYPEEELYSLHHYSEKCKNNRWNYSFRMTMPFIEGKKARSFANEDLATSQDVAKLFLRIAQAIQALHEKGIIHGDIGNRNLLVKFNETRDDIIVQLIDFGKSYNIKDMISANYIRSQKENEKFYDNEFAPELYNQADDIAANTAQDIYPLGNTFEYILTKLDDQWVKFFLKKYPAIEQFMRESRNPDPALRPTLNSLICALMPIIDWETTLSQPMQKLMHALHNQYPAGARQLLEKNTRHYSQRELRDLLQTCLTCEDYLAAAKLIAIKNRLLTSSLTDEQQALVRLYGFTLHCNDAEAKLAANYIANIIQRGLEIDRDSPDYQKYQDIVVGNRELNEIIEALNNANVIQIPPYTNSVSCIIN